jgi:hypothetical protein
MPTREVGGGYFALAKPGQGLDADIQDLRTVKTAAMGMQNYCTLPPANA